MNKYLETAPKSLKSAKKTGGFGFIWMASEKAFVTSALQGITIAMIFAFFILLIATRNIILAFLAIICVSIVIVSVIAIM